MFNNKNETNGKNTFLNDITIEKDVKMATDIRKKRKGKGVEVAERKNEYIITTIIIQLIDVRANGSTKQYLMLICTLYRIYKPPNNV